jgi:hypothetical protein
VITRDPPRPADGFVEVGNRPASPAANLVAEQTPPAQQPAADGARGDHAAARLVTLPRRSHLDRVAIAVPIDDERGVVEVATRTMPARGLDRLVDTPVEADAVAARPERDPVQVNGGGRGHSAWKLRSDCADRHPHWRAEPVRVVRRAYGGWFQDSGRGWTRNFPRRTASTAIRPGSNDGSRPLQISVIAQ